MRPNFEEKFTELDNLWVLWTVHGTHWQRHKCFDFFISTQSKWRLSVRLERMKNVRSSI